jgi:hypothetical protein
MFTWTVELSLLRKLVILRAVSWQQAQANRTA